MGSGISLPSQTGTSMVLDRLKRPPGSGFGPNKGDTIAAAFRNGAWDVAAVRSDSHDDWDNRGFVDAKGNPHTSAVDPRAFAGGGRIQRH